MPVINSKKDIPKIDPVVLDNKPQRGYRLVGADTRYRGNTAWKVITPEGYLVDLRPDVFLPILYSRGVPASGMLDAEFEWCVSGAQARLEEVGSDNHAKYMTEKEFYAGRK